MPDPRQIAATMPGRRTDYAFGLSIEAWLPYKAAQERINQTATTEAEYHERMTEMVQGWKQ